MPLIDVAALTHLGWDTVKEIVKEDLAERYKSVSLKEVKRIAIDEIHIGAKAKFYTLVIDLESGHSIHIAKGRGAEALRKFWRRVMSLAKTLSGHALGILNYFRFPISSGKLEGINNKVGCLKRAAYGYRDEAFFVLKLYSLHESSLRLSGV